MTCLLHDEDIGSVWTIHLEQLHESHWRLTRLAAFLIKTASSVLGLDCIGGSAPHIPTAYLGGGP